VVNVKPVTVHVAKTQLSKLIERACAGEEVVIARGRIPVVRLVPIAKVPPRRRFGAMRGRAGTTRAFFTPLPHEELDAWER
jgi:prevent-host-death family protein